MTEQRHHTGTPVVVGVDGSEHSLAAADLAGADAARRGLPLEIVYGYLPGTRAAWYETPLFVLYAQAGQSPPAVPEAVTRVVTELSDKHPQIGVHPEVRQHMPAHEALVAASKHARLAVVGSRGLGGFRGLLLGSVSQALIYHAHCPVAIVR